MTTTPYATRDRAEERTLRLPFGFSWTTLALLGIVILAAALRLANIGAVGQANGYYTAAVKSMLQSWHNFFFVAAEPGGSVTVDKPPVGLWLQAASAYFLGVNGFAVVLPQILAGIASVVVLFHLVRRSFGAAAGLAAAFALAVTPVAVAVERNNTPDATLIFTLLLAAWAFIKATETRRLGWLLAGAALVGVGFNIKMMQALLPLPALYALYLFGSAQPWRRKIAHLSLATLVLIPVALSWAVAVDLTPADQRPYVGSSSSNSELDLMLGYNGIQRLTGLGGARPVGDAARADGQTQAGQRDGAVQGPGAGMPPFAGGPGGGAGGMFGTGQAGPLRLFQSGLAAQVSWLLPFGLLALLATALGLSWRRPQTALHHGVILWGGWLVTCAVFFSVAGFFHQYYLAMLGPPLAASVALGVVFLWRLGAERPLRAGLLLLAGVAVTLAYQVYAVALYQAPSWWNALPFAPALLGAALLVRGLRAEPRRLAPAAVAALVAALLVVPAVWSGLTNAAAANQMLPEAYSGARGGFGVPGARRDGLTPPANAAFGGGQGVSQQLLSYLEANTKDTKYLVVVPSAGAGEGLVLATGRPVLYAGGFSGSDPVIDGDGLAELVAQGQVRYVLWGGDGRGGGTGASITSYLQSSCKVVTDAGLGTGATAASGGQNGAQQPGGPGGFGRASTLYQCGAS
jgi:4-amino-4-deoxy-L-arabinose transferase-like glycosyltransferase